MKKAFFFLLPLILFQLFLCIKTFNLQQKILKKEQDISLKRIENQKLETEVDKQTSCHKIYELTSKEYFLETFSLASLTENGAFVAFRVSK